MCGIAGIKKLGTDPITIDQINVLLCSLQHRGTDATGIALMAGADIQIFKDDEEAWKFIALTGYKSFMDEHFTDAVDTVLLHTRASTIGNPRENKNNHPLSLGGAAIIHNGSISNHNAIFAKLKVDRSAETDSDAIRALIDIHGITPAAIKGLQDLEGSIAAACIHPDYPGKLMLLRSGSPLVIAQVGTNMMWASEKAAIQRAARPWDKWAGFWVQENKASIRWAAAQADSAFLIGPEGLEYHAEFKSCRYYSTPDYSRLRKEHEARQARFDTEAATTTVVTQTVIRDGKEITYYLCRNPKCKCKMAVPDKFRNIPVEQLRCPVCGFFVVAPKSALVAIN